MLSGFPDRGLNFTPHLQFEPWKKRGSIVRAGVACIWLVQQTMSEGLSAVSADTAAAYREQVDEVGIGCCVSRPSVPGELLYVQPSYSMYLAAGNEP
ncbi:Hypothetical protein NTJ_07150 [Nesidiocoris tenuis]|uniref:Uncharacterized protein n=1 Tax=Nesidiocoris tenuis TaxID=355587 RepID=A0ABN7AQ40_9HEMI|nr:Hypothetical protein NTJ_07150 [Nesidiocoris tenuis]